MKLSIGDTFRSKWISGNPLIKVVGVVIQSFKHSSKLTVKIGEGENTSWEEDWNLQHTIWGFERGDYYDYNSFENKRDNLIEYITEPTISVKDRISDWNYLRPSPYKDGKLRYPNLSHEREVIGPYDKLSPEVSRQLQEHSVWHTHIGRGAFQSTIKKYPPIVVPKPTSDPDSVLYNKAITLLEDYMTSLNKDTKRKLEFVNKEGWETVFKIVESIPSEDPTQKEVMYNEDEVRMLLRKILTYCRTHNQVPKLSDWWNENKKR